MTHGVGAEGAAVANPFWLAPEEGVSPDDDLYVQRWRNQVLIWVEGQNIPLTLPEARLLVEALTRAIDHA